MPVWTDAHNHLHDPRLGDPSEVLAEMRTCGISRCVVNAVVEENWPIIAQLAAEHPSMVFPAFGIHPWEADGVAVGWQDRLTEILKIYPHSSVGECGIDRWVDHPSLDSQLPVFLDQLRIARELDRPITIHCLKAWGPLMDAFAREAPPSRFLMHSYSGSAEFARELIPLGAYFSFSGYFLHERKSKMLDVFRELPPERILLETDAPDMAPPEAAITHPLPEARNHPANLPAIGGALAAVLGTSTWDLAELTSANASRCFGF